MVARHLEFAIEVYSQSKFNPFALLINSDNNNTCAFIDNDYYLIIGATMWYICSLIIERFYAEVAPHYLYCNLCLFYSWKLLSHLRLSIYKLSL